MKFINKFIKSFTDNRDSEYHHQERVVFASEQIKEALGVSDLMLDKMVDGGHSMDITIRHGGGLFLVAKFKITLKATSRSFIDGWANLIEVIPDTDGYNKISDIHGWTTMGVGTTKSILPSDDVMLKVMKEVIKIAKG